MYVLLKHNHKVRSRDKYDQDMSCQGAQASHKYTMRESLKGMSWLHLHLDKGLWLLGEGRIKERKTRGILFNYL